MTFVNTLYSIDYDPFNLNNITEFDYITKNFNRQQISILDTKKSTLGQSAVFRLIPINLFTN